MADKQPPIRVQTIPLLACQPSEVPTIAAAISAAGAWRDWRGYRRMMRADEDRQDEPNLSLMGRGIRLIRSVAELSPGHGHPLRQLTRTKDGLMP